MAHLTVDAWLLELDMIDVETSTVYVSQLTRMAHGANCLIAGRGIELLPGPRVGAFTSRTVYHLPEIYPLLAQHVVLNRKYVDFAVGKFRGIGLLKF